MADLICTTAVRCNYKRNSMGKASVCSRFKNKAECIHAMTVAEMTADIAKIEVG